MILRYVVIFSALAVSGAAFGGALAWAKDSRLKVIDFEDQVVEGMNKRPLDSLNQFDDAAGKERKPHLYRKRVGFRSETEQTLDELGVQP